MRTWKMLRPISLLVALLLLAVPAPAAMAHESPPPPPPPPAPQTLQGFDFRYQDAELAPTVDSVHPAATLAGRRHWRFSLINHSPTPVTNATITVNSALNPSLFPNLTGGFPLVASQPVLGPEESLTVHTLETSNVPVNFHTAYAASRAMQPLNIPPGGGPQTVTVKVTPRGARYAFPSAHIAVNISGNVLSATNPDTSNGETLDYSPVAPSTNAGWMLHKVLLDKEYVFSAVLQVQNNSPVHVPTRPQVRVEMTAHDGGPFPAPPGPSLVIPDPALQGSITYSVNEANCTWNQVRDDYFVVQFPSARGPVMVKTDIKPGSDPNSINLNRGGVVAIALLSITPQQADGQFAPLDATLLNPASIRIMDAADHHPGIFPAGAAPVRSATEDVDGDGDTDLVLIFQTQDLIDLGKFDANTTAARLYGPAIPGQPPMGIFGKDSVRIVPAK